MYVNFQPNIYFIVSCQNYYTGPRSRFERIKIKISNKAYQDIIEINSFFIISFLE